MDSQISDAKTHFGNQDVDNITEYNGTGPDVRSPFERERDVLVTQITESMNNVLNNLNALNRALEGVVEVGKEFESISALWNNYYDGMARVQIQEQQQQQQQHQQQQQQQQQQQEEEEVNEEQDQEVEKEEEEEEEEAQTGMQDHPVNQS
ncbi:uncharacterized protein SAPINGB_P002626 [Magnusiomyces paraingens]|uniref:DASH complex subunit DAD1 n=1 Tax=Magnusiomyces paraingens TaxID=2606893 RepID=A0A5E8BH22_9ASCO|nr:uncharacterized protein SAPINGB_P002626 [Saprochaete ingens]VVT50151.1 unnamed protein product [Saprochaete ingens]